MVKVLVYYGYAPGTFSSRKLATKLVGNIAFRMLAGLPFARVVTDRQVRPCSPAASGIPADERSVGRSGRTDTPRDRGWRNRCRRRGSVPGRSGSIGWVWSSAWIWFFSWDRAVGRVEVESDDVVDLLGEERIGGELEVRLPLRPRQSRWTVDFEIPVRIRRWTGSSNACCRLPARVSRSTVLPNAWLRNAASRYAELRARPSPNARPGVPRPKSDSVLTCLLLGTEFHSGFVGKHADSIRMVRYSKRCSWHARTACDGRSGSEGGEFLVGRGGPVLA